ncbi:permease prefix domain 1-containing protein [Paenibacillus aurantiacus]|uniref:Permease prefix domain 1-containing protein n=1 Tax=Paenibacillus aurantiacus TaxID=1936118 RepID=A0ABV5KMU9_9BACL
MSNRKIDDYLDTLFPYPSNPKRLEMRSELRHHLEDALEDYAAMGYNEEEALKLAIASLGDAKTLRTAIRRHGRDCAKARWVWTAILAIFILSLGVLQVLPLPLFLMLATVLVFGYLLAIGAVIELNVLTNKEERLKDAGPLSAMGGLGLRYKDE